MPSAQARPPLARRCREPKRQGVDEFARSRQSRCLDQAFGIDLRRRHPEGNILCDGAVDQEDMLCNVGHLRPPTAAIGVIEHDAVDAHLAGLRGQQTK
jgi:hypothetical protein